MSETVFDFFDGRLPDGPSQNSQMAHLSLILVIKRPVSTRNVIGAIQSIYVKVQSHTFMLEQQHLWGQQVCRLRCKHLLLVSLPFAHVTSISLAWWNTIWWAVFSVWVDQHNRHGLGGISHSVKMTMFKALGICTYLRDPILFNRFFFSGGAGVATCFLVLLFVEGVMSVFGADWALLQ